VELFVVIGTWLEQAEAAGDEAGPAIFVILGVPA
jgi:hypothetical protein